METKKVAIVTTHPIQYYAPVFKILAKKVDLKVFYTWGEESIKKKFDPGFGKVVDWDLPLLDGYNYEFLENSSTDPGSHHFKGIINPSIIERINEFCPDVILVYGWSYSSHFKVLRHFKGKRQIWFRGDSNLLDLERNWKSIVRKLLLRYIYSHVDRAFYVGSCNKDYFVEYGLKPTQLAFAPHSIENSRFEEDHKKDVDELKNSLGIEDTEIVILFAGKLEPKKNPELLMDAFLNLDLKNVHLLFVGNGVLESKLKEKQSNNLENSNALKISFLDFQNQSRMPVIYQCCDLFCLPSKGPGETWGLAVNEAMASGKSILVSNKVGCAKDLVKTENGLIFESDNLLDLSIKLRELCNSKERLKIMGEKSRTIIQSWSFSKQVEAFELGLYDDTR
ncbi:glycosyltransferase family 4 protein [Desertivirga brevis]|uniref:glycosyltransferase family 4 protein n=1 Tax=Desertivirga brevis TaxID=2810310 RepID=UPI001A959D0F|nr:glycosyltransferase family 4 protein [Pedobacter sp. SYSU D00873]